MVLTIFYNLNCGKFAPSKSSKGNEKDILIAVRVSLTHILLQIQYMLDFTNSDVR